MSDLPPPRGLFNPVTEVQRDEFHVLGAVEHTVGKKALQEDAKAPERQAGDQRESEYNPAEDDDVEEQVGEIVFLVSESIFIPGDIGFIVLTRGRAET